MRTLVIRSALVVCALIVAHEIMAAWLARTDVIERLLAPHGDGAFSAMVQGGTFLVLRLTLLFVVPGAVLTRVVLAWWEARTSKVDAHALGETR